MLAADMPLFDCSMTFTQSSSVNTLRLFLRGVLIMIISFENHISIKNQIQKLMS